MAAALLLLTPVGEVISLTWSIPTRAPFTIPPISANINDTVAFTWSSWHNVYRSASREDFDGCMKTGGAVVASVASGGTFYFTASVPGEYLFICTVGGHCASGQKVAITVADPPPPPTPPMPPMSPVSCFPSTAIVSMRDGARKTIDTLREGDEILAATAGDGRLVYDAVSLFSLADPAADAALLTLVTDSNATLTLTPTHRLPIGAACCAVSEQARHVTVGQCVWVAPHPTAIANAGAQLLQPAMVVAIAPALPRTPQPRGLFSPLLAHGTLPVVDGVATAFNSPHIVALDSLALPLALLLCKAFSTCSALRRTVAVVECARQRLLGTASCKGFRFVDGLVVLR